jgi:tripartite-type tricarboxylate transporter receptor subunit TctC
MKMKAVSCRGLLASVTGALAMPALAQEAYTARSVRIIVPFAAGGGADAVARALAQKLSERLGSGLIVRARI